MADTSMYAAERSAHLGIAARNYNRSDSDIIERAKEVAFETTCTHDTHHTQNGAELPDARQPAGVRQMEAISLVWTKKWLMAAYVFIALISFANSLQQIANISWNPYVTSAFQKHGLTAMTSTVASVVSGVTKLPLATFINVCGRPHGFAICMVCTVLALIMMALCQNVQTYAAAQVFYWTGMNGMLYVLDIFIADTTQLKNRLIWLTITTSPFICNAFAGPEMAQRYLEHGGWRWGYGTFAIITPLVCVPFWAISFFMNRKAQKLGIIRTRKSDITLAQSVVHWWYEFDVVGLLLIITGFSLILLPLSLATWQNHSWASPNIIYMFVFGALCLVLFIVWERFGAQKTFLPFHLLKDRSVVAACLLGCNGWIAFYSYKMYYNSYLQVVFGLSVAKAGYIISIYNIVSCGCAVIISLAFRYTDTYRWAGFIAVPTQIAMAGLLIKFRTPGTSLGLLIMVEILNAVGAAILVQIGIVAVMAAVPHEHVATAYALMQMVTSIGGSVGQGISGAVWTNIVPQKIRQYLPADKKEESAAIYHDLWVQLSYPMGSPEREATIKAYADAQKVMMIAGTCALVPCFLWVAMLKNYRLSQHRARKGVLA